LAGYDSKGPHLCEVTATGFTTYVPFVSMGSGSLNALSLLETRYKDDLTMEEATQLAIDAIKAGIIYDNGSGSNVDFVQITKDNIHYERNFEIVGKMSEIKGDYSVTPGNIERLASTTISLRKGDEEDNRIQEESVSRQSPDNKLDIEN
jgi:20S proteasome subunit beta 2